MLLVKTPCQIFNRFVKLIKMIILGIETSCDETAISIIETEGQLGGDFKVKILANEIMSQIAIHRQYGGVYPSVAKREHAKNLVPLLIQALKHSSVLQNTRIVKSDEVTTETKKYSQILQDLRIDEKREPEMWEQFEKEIPKIARPEIDAIAVTKGPGLEPALWTGINLSKALSAVWDVPLIPVNHMEGHIFAALLSKDETQDSGLKIQEDSNLSTYNLKLTTFPAIALLVSGGHTELISIKDWFKYELIGGTRDDAVGEAFDKVARILGLPYPGGPEISRLAEKFRLEISTNNRQLTTHNIKFPRPMIKSGDSDFSFSGLKTSVLYTVKKLPELTDDLKAEIAAAFEDSAIETLTEKTRHTITETNAKTLIVGGGVAANKLLRQKLTEMAKQESADIFISEISHSTDNALMIALAGAGRYQKFGANDSNDFKAEGGYRIDKIL